MDLGALLKGQWVLVTGASSGLGAHFARLAAKCGASVVVAARRRDKLDALAAELSELGAPHVRAIELDVSDADSVRAAFASVAAGGNALDVVINNAGISGDGMAIDQPVAEFDAVMGTNLRGVWLVATEAARQWKAAGRGGAIVNIASIQGERVLSPTFFRISPPCLIRIR